MTTIKIKTKTMKQLQSNKSVLTCALVGAALILSACSTVSSLTDNTSGIDYKSSKAAPKLDIPPDLTQLRPNERYSNARASALGRPGVAASNQQNALSVLPNSTVVRMERLGNTRFLVVDSQAENVYPKITDFWKDSGFTLAIDSPRTGLIETDWAENRDKIPASGLRKVLGGVIDGMFDSGERDKYRTRLERVGNSTEIYLSHKGTREVNVSSRGVSEFKQINRDGNIELETEFLRRLMVHLGADDLSAKTAAGGASTGGAATAQRTAPDRARIVADKNILALDDGFDAAWRRLGLALDRSGFTIDDRNYSAGEYYIRYARVSNEKDGFFAKMFSDEKKTSSQKLKVLLQKGTPSTVQIQTEQGVPADADIVKNLLNVLRDELK